MPGIANGGGGPAGTMEGMIEGQKVRVVPLGMLGGDRGGAGWRCRCCYCWVVWSMSGVLVCL